MKKLRDNYVPKQRTSTTPLASHKTQFQYDPPQFSNLRDVASTPDTKQSGRPGRRITTGSEIGIAPVLNWAKQNWILAPLTGSVNVVLQPAHGGWPRSSEEFNTKFANKVRLSRVTSSAWNGETNVACEERIIRFPLDFARITALRIQIMLNLQTRPYGRKTQFVEYLTHNNLDLFFLHNSPVIIIPFYFKIYHSVASCCDLDGCHLILHIVYNHMCRRVADECSYRENFILTICSLSHFDLDLLRAIKSRDASRGREIKADYFRL